MIWGTKFCQNPPNAPFFVFPLAQGSITRRENHSVCQHNLPDTTYHFAWYPRIRHDYSFRALTTVVWANDEVQDTVYASRALPVECLHKRKFVSGNVQSASDRRDRVYFFLPIAAWYAEKVVSPGRSPEAIIATRLIPVLSSFSCPFQLS